MRSEQLPPVNGRRKWSGRGLSPGHLSTTISNTCLSALREAAGVCVRKLRAALARGVTGSTSSTRFKHDFRGHRKNRQARIAAEPVHDETLFAGAGLCNNCRSRTVLSYQERQVLHGESSGSAVAWGGSRRCWRGPGAEGPQRQRV